MSWLLKNVLDEYDWKFGCVLIGCIFMQICVFGALLKPTNHQLKQLSCMQNANTTAFEIIKKILKDIIDFNLLRKNVPFMFITVSLFFVYCGHFLPFVYIPQRAKELSIERYDLILGVIGVVNIISRLIIGLLADKSFLSSVNLNIISIASCCIGLYVYFLLDTLLLQFVFSILYGFGIGIFFVEFLLIFYFGKINNIFFHSFFSFFCFLTLKLE
jgi:hypothetical protein